MIDLSNIEQLAKSLTSQLPEGLGSVKDDIEKNFKSVLQQQFVKLDLVTREEFDTQSAVLARTREKLDSLEKTIAELTSNNK
jgi:BMFP domain-containing protein YqiC